PHEEHKGDRRSVVRKSYEQIRERGFVELFRSHRPDYADGMQERDFLYVKDAVRMVLHLALTPSAAGLYNLGSGRVHTWVELVSAVFGALGMEPEIRVIDMPEGLRARYQYHTLADLTRLRGSGYDEAVMPLREAVRDYVVG